MQQVILTLALVFSSVLFAQTNEKSALNEGSSISATVVNALSDDGTIEFALYDEANFLKKPLLSKSSTVKNGRSIVTFENVPAGNYAIVCFHDANSNKRMDFQENGMPLENFGTSNNPMNFGPPEFDSSKFEVINEDATLEIKF